MINRSNLRAALSATPECLSLERLESLTMESQMHSHVSMCAHCHTELALLKEFKSNTPLPDEGAAVAWISTYLERRLDQFKNPKLVPQRRGISVGWLTRLFGKSQLRWLVPVAGVLMLAVASIIVLRTKEPELQAKLGSGPAVYRSQEVEVLAPLGELPEPPKNLQWKGFGGASEYKISLMEVDKAQLWSTETLDTSVPIPKSTRDKLLPGKPLLWQVTALDSQRRTLATSQLDLFFVARKSPVANSKSLSH